MKRKRAIHDDLIKVKLSFCVTGPLWGESVDYLWISLTKASDAELLYFLWSAPEPTIEQTQETQVIWDAIAFIMTPLLWWNKQIQGVILVNVNVIIHPCFNLNYCLVNTWGPRQNGRHFADDTFKRIFLKENVRISIKISLKFVPKNPIDNIPALFQIMAWRRPGDKSLSEAMMVGLLTHICVARPQWVKPPLKLGHRWVITITHHKRRMWLLLHFPRRNPGWTMLIKRDNGGLSVVTRHSPPGWGPRAFP